MLPTLELNNDIGANVNPRSKHESSDSDGGSKHGKLDLEGVRDIEGVFKCSFYSERVYYGVSREWAMRSTSNSGSSAAGSSTFII